MSKLREGLAYLGLPIPALQNGSYLTVNQLQSPIDTRIEYLLKMLTLIC